MANLAAACQEEMDWNSHFCGSFNVTSACIKM